MRTSYDKNTFAKLNTIFNNYMSTLHATTICINYERAEKLILK